jgi:hypothetical protein
MQRCRELGISWLGFVVSGIDSANSVSSLAERVPWRPVRPSHALHLSRADSCLLRFTTALLRECLRKNRGHPLWSTRTCIAIFDDAW